MERSAFVDALEIHMESDPDRTSMLRYNRMLLSHAGDNPHSVWAPEYRRLLEDRATWKLENDRLVALKMERPTFLGMVEKHMESDPDRTSMKDYNQMLEERAGNNPHSVWTPEYRELLEDRATWKLENDRLVAMWNSINESCNQVSPENSIDSIELDSIESIELDSIESIESIELSWKIVIQQ